MCLTLGEDTRNDTNRIKALSLEACSEDGVAHQVWGKRTAED
ncbi:hypothetical protein [Palleronia rufa]|nr:hypothetical protein [Palleronia rufa]